MNADLKSIEDFIGVYQRSSAVNVSFAFQGL
jgi:hypothetical protein